MRNFLVIIMLTSHNNKKLSCINVLTAHNVKHSHNNGLKIMRNNIRHQNETVIIESFP